MEEKIPRTFKKNVNYYLKNKKAAYDLLLLHQILKSEQNIENTRGIISINNIINNLCDSEIVIPYKDTKTINIFDKLEEIYKCLVKKYKKNEYCLNELEKLKEPFLFNTAYIEFYHMRSEEYNIIKELLLKSPAWLKEFLVSDINFEIRYEIFKEVMCYAIKETPTSIIEILTLDDNISRTDKNIQKEKIKELLDNFNNDSNARKELLKELIVDDKTKYIKMLKNNDIDLNNLFGTVYPCRRKVSTIFKIFNETGIICEDLYEDNSYLYIPLNIRDNNDIFILKKIECERIYELIRLNNFRITEAKLDIIAKRLYEYKDKEKLEEIKAQILETVNNKKLSKEDSFVYLLLTSSFNNNKSN